MKLHIGGEAPKAGWNILNIQLKNGVDYIGDISNLSQFHDETFDEVYASHVFEHVRQKDVIKTLAGINRIIKKGGRFHVSVPDMDELCNLYLNQALNFEQRWHVMRMMFGGQTDDFDYHYVGGIINLYRLIYLVAIFPESREFPLLDYFLTLANSPLTASQLA